MWELYRINAPFCRCALSHMNGTTDVFSSRLLLHVNWLMGINSLMTAGVMLKVVPLRHLYLMARLWLLCCNRSTTQGARGARGARGERSERSCSCRKCELYKVLSHRLGGKEIRGFFDWLRQGSSLTDLAIFIKWLCERWMFRAPPKKKQTGSTQKKEFALRVGFSSSLFVSCSETNS